MGNFIAILKIRERTSCEVVCTNSYIWGGIACSTCTFWVYHRYSRELENIFERSSRKFAQNVLGKLGLLHVLVGCLPWLCICYLIDYKCTRLQSLTDANMSGSRSSGGPLSLALRGARGGDAGLELPRRGHGVGASAQRTPHFFRLISHHHSTMALRSVACAAARGRYPPSASATTGGRQAFPIASSAHHVPLHTSHDGNDEANTSGSSTAIHSSSSYANARRAHAPHIRCYSTTPRREIIPIIAVGLVAVTTRYSYKALQRMDAEWEEYEEELREYKLSQGLDPDADLPSSSSPAGAGNTASGNSTATYFKNGTIGIDLGTTNLRIAHASPTTSFKPHVIVDREGGRATPNSIYYEHDGTAVVGRLAHSKLHERPEGDVLNPHDMMKAEVEDDNLLPAVEEVVRNALEQALGSGGGSNSREKGSLFAIDSSLSGGYDVRPVFAYPAPSLGHADEADIYKNRYEAAVYTLSEPTGIFSFVQEPVAAVLGAVRENLMTAPKEPILVLDVGGTVTSASLVAPDASSSQGYDVTHSLRLDGLGGETLVDALVSHLCRFFYEQPTEQVTDGMALQRLYDASRAAVLEISGGKDRVQVNIPYLSVDEKMQPRHLDVGVSKVVLEHEIKDILKSRQQQYQEQGVLSKSMSQASDLTSLLSSIIMRLLEESGSNPFALENILIAGGGARSPIVQMSIKGALEGLGGPQLAASDKLIVPPGELVEEIVVLGTAAVAEK